MREIFCCFCHLILLQCRYYSEYTVTNNLCWFMCLFLQPDGWSEDFHDRSGVRVSHWLADGSSVVGGISSVAEWTGESRQTASVRIDRRGDNVETKSRQSNTWWGLAFLAVWQLQPKVVQTVQSCMNFCGHVGHVTIFSWMFTISCCSVIG